MIQPLIVEHRLELWCFCRDLCTFAPCCEVQWYAHFVQELKMTGWSCKSWICKRRALDWIRRLKPCSCTSRSRRISPKCCLVQGSLLMCKSALLTPASHACRHCHWNLCRATAAYKYLSQHFRSLSHRGTAPSHSFLYFHACKGAVFTALTPIPRVEALFDKPFTRMQGHMQERGQPLLGLPGQMLPNSFQQDPYRQLPQQQGDLAPALPPHLHPEQAVVFDRGFGGAALQSYNSSEGSGIPHLIHAPSCSF